MGMAVGNLAVGNLAVGFSPLFYVKGWFGWQQAFWQWALAHCFRSWDGLVGSGL